MIRLFIRRCIFKNHFWILTFLQTSHAKKERRRKWLCHVSSTKWREEERIELEPGRGEGGELWPSRCSELELSCWECLDVDMKREVENPNRWSAIQQSCWLCFSRWQKDFIELWKCLSRTVQNIYNSIISYDTIWDPSDARFFSILRICYIIPGCCFQDS